MKLLIVDDEELTRNGLTDSIDWKSLGIHQLFHAEDGLSGLRIAKDIKPDIVLCDVRMPRMDGIQLVEKLENLIPNSAFIFMSGYSDKEYLKAAIRLKAVNYVEKPLNLAEVINSVKEACQCVRQNMKTVKNELYYSRGTASSLAAALTYPYKKSKETIEILSQELGLKNSSGLRFTSYLVKLEQTNTDSVIIEHMLGNFENFLSPSHMQVYYISKYIQYHIFHIASPLPPSGRTLDRASNFLKSYFKQTGTYYISRGETAVGISKAYESYARAVSLMQSSFFFDSGTVFTQESMTAKRPGKTDRIADGCWVSGLSEAVLSKDYDAIKNLLKQLFENFYQSQGIFPHQVKDLYYKLFVVLEDCRQQLKLAPDIEQENAMKLLENCFSFQELHQNLIKKTELLYEAALSYVPENSTIYLIKDYIRTHYSDESLSVCDIGNQVFLSTSYVCTYFKNETGQTINQYLTDFRIKKAKELLADFRFQITDISNKVGYSNGNYFSKSFKKLTGLSPSEYREKMLR